MADVAARDAESDQVDPVPERQTDDDRERHLRAGAVGRLRETYRRDQHSRGQRHADQADRRTDDTGHRAARVVTHMRPRRIAEADVLQRVQVLAELFEVVLTAWPAALARDIAVDGGERRREGFGGIVIAHGLFDPSEPRDVPDPG